MSLWFWVLAACAAVYATKLLGYLVPQSWLVHPAVGRVSAMLTIGLLAALVAMNTFSAEASVTIDARLGALLAAALALLLRAPFIVVVLVGAGAAAGIRALG
ncbi:AzlD domain-containing protein [Nesterenkonia aurantiaca]|uniref:Branched-subunit amino acid transport protein AzlD n=1 Tax=Nesterenkonia aurantiaca TaxID=1436010 RepID=A0A4R7G2G1_9MICC|nr:AzlD domain-containing protein [Nesterenkonia aurantiaca]TDS85367.1 branched-subunit amino acid transport protein AzlD [Nesterenkonia aurantiaca]